MRRVVNGRSAPAVAVLCDRAAEIMRRAFPKRATSHGFHDPRGFIADCRRDWAQNLIRRALLNALIDREIAAGRLALEGNLIVLPQ